MLFGGVWIGITHWTLLPATLSSAVDVMVSDAPITICDAVVQFCLIADAMKVDIDEPRAIVLS